jgi:hypothetical protein
MGTALSACRGGGASSDSAHADAVLRCEASQPQRRCLALLHACARPSAGEASAAQGDPFAALPHGVAVAIFALLPFEARLRAAAVCRAWRATLREPSAWLDADLCHADGTPCAPGALLHLAAARAAGQLRSLRVACDEQHGEEAALSAELRHVAAANGGTLEALRLHAPAGVALAALRALLALPALSRLRTLEADVCVEAAADARAVLRGEAPFERLRVRSLHVAQCRGWSTEALSSLVYDIKRKMGPPPPRLCLRHVALHVDGQPSLLLDALVDAALASRIACLELYECALSPACAPALARLLRGDALTELAITGPYGARQYLDEEALARALRENTSLTSLTLRSVGVWVGGGVPAGTLLSRALAAHPRLRALDLSDNSAAAQRGSGGGGGADSACFGAALGALVTANAPALSVLSVDGDCLGDVALRPLFAALRVDTRLRALRVRCSGVSAPFAARVLAPAVRANAGLRRLDARSSRARRRCDVLAHKLHAARLEEANDALRAPHGCFCFCDGRGAEEAALARRVRHAQRVHAALRAAEARVASRA